MREQRRDLALRVGADIAIDPRDPDFDRVVQEATAGNGFPYVVDAVGSSRVLESAIRIAARGGNILLFGVARPDDVASVRPNEIYAREAGPLFIDAARIRHYSRKTDILGSMAG